MEFRIGDKVRILKMRDLKLEHEEDELQEGWTGTIIETGCGSSYHGPYKVDVEEQGSWEWCKADEIGLIMHMPRWERKIS